MHKGFTLIELLVVVLIIGILSAVALPQYTKAVQRARVTELWSYCKAFRDAQEVYYLANGKYTEDLANLDVQLPELKDGTFSIGGAGSTAIIFFGHLSHFPDFSFSCSLENFSCGDASKSNKCVTLMPCSNPTIRAGSGADCYF